VSAPEVAGRRYPLTWADRIVLYALVGLGVAFLLTTARSGPAQSVRIEGAGGFGLTAVLDEDATYEIRGPLGTTVVRVEGGAARVESSPCRQQICVRMGAARKPGAVVVCVPNEVVVRVMGSVDRVQDATTR
jgi:hypothetical protein